MGALFILTHVVLASPLMGSDFSGLIQLKWQETSLPLLSSPILILGLFFMIAAAKLKLIILKRKESVQ